MQHETAAPGNDRDRVSGLSIADLSGGQAGQRISGTSSSDK